MKATGSRIRKLEVTKFFQGHPQKVFRSARDLKHILKTHGGGWGVPKTWSTPDFVDWLLEHTELQEIELLPVDEKYQPFLLWGWGKPTNFEIGLRVRTQQYLSHGSAVFLHALTDEIPTTTFVNKEQSAKPTPPRRTLRQEAVNRAFGGKQRQSNYVFTDDSGDRIVLLSGKQTSQLEVGVIRHPDSGASYRATKLERTLIDIVVRPEYAGGVFKVAEAYASAVERGDISMTTMVATIKRLGHVYPYHQAIGFLLEKAGYQGQGLDRLRALGLDVDFFVANSLAEPDFVKEWRLFVPKGF